MLPRLHGIAPNIRCEMRRKGHEAFEKYFATVSGNVRGLMEVLERHWRRGRVVGWHRRWRVSSGKSSLFHVFQ